MNSLSTGTFDPVALAAIVADVSTLIGEADTSTEVTFYTQGVRALDPGTGTVSYGDTGRTLSAFLGPLSWKQRQVPGTQEGDVQVLVPHSALADAPKVGTRFRAGSDDYSVYQAESGPLSTHYVILARRAE